MNRILKQTIEHWGYIAPLVAYPRNKREFESLRSRLNELLDVVKNNEAHPLMGLIDIMGDVVIAYEADTLQSTMGKGVDALKFLIEMHQLNQSDLSEIGSQGVISEILHGKRSLNLRQIKLLAKRFHVAPSTFIDEK